MSVSYLLINDTNELNTAGAEFPIIIALDNEELAGFIGTGTPNGIWMVGPFWARSPIIALRLIENYDKVVKFLGIKEYFFNVEPENKKWIDQIERFGLKRHSEDRDHIWYKRSI